MTTLIKICGMTDIAAVEAAVEVIKRSQNPGGGR